MKWATAALWVAVIVVAATSVTVIAESQAAAVTRTRQLTAPTAAAIEPPPGDAVRSVRSYQQVAEPVKLHIPAIGVDTPLVQLHRAADDTVEVPSDFGVAGWFADGPRPGQPGPAVVLGHVDSRAGPAVFFRLTQLKQGAQVVVDRADGSTVTFRVSSTQRVPKVEFPTAEVYAQTLEPSLRLVTCGGSFDRAARRYRDNVIVYANPAE
jgi:LPXTG-site transpeptidase (sortase) family protein